MYKLHIQIEGPLREVQRAFKIKKKKEKKYMEKMVLFYKYIVK